MAPSCVPEWLKDLAPVVVSIAVLGVTFSFNRWQRRLAKEQLRHQLYERRAAIYAAFRELLIALPEKSDNEIKTLFRKATIARFEVPFLFEYDPKLQAYLEQLCKQVGEDVISNIVSLDAMGRAGLPMNDPQMIQDMMNKTSQLGAAKLEIPDRHLRELPQEFARFLKLTDFSKR
jgi:hypothetical protein